MTLAGKRVVILGGTAGIGLAVARLAAEAGASVVVGSRDRARVEAAKQLLSIEGHVVDLSQHSTIGAFFERVGPYDHLVYTAGESLLLGAFGDLDLDAAKQFFEVRFWGAFTAAKVGMAGIRPGGSITFSSGTASMRPGPRQSVVASALSGVEGLTRALAVELAPVRVNVVVPDVVRTELWRDMAKGDRDDFYAGVASRLPVGHVGAAEEVAQAYLYSMLQTYGTGQSIVVDGGKLLS